MNFGGKREYLLKMESTAMSDIVFILLIFFLLSSNFMIQTGIEVDLPTEVAPKPIETREVVVTLTKEGDAFVNETRVGLDALEPALAGALEKAASKVVVIRGDQATLFGNVVQVMEMGQRAGAEGIAVATQASSGGDGNR
ncbi:MAG: biopolymer transporter ExbD [Candidatus Eisenbacteria bacterium]|uniref:Biopolymer transporter ExbD n=1 Tax=Eiseniibacteriota bacterium TaxID=2212470 RepID=A0A956NC10_UNCEI|nr:biopolymer transporter ExbD [Candidatus Eisenbacteria bacterium]MCB9463009.1 biopolymer transporter ExbD [Candidatus Eisenbacteria bacterium]